MPSHPEMKAGTMAIAAGGDAKEINDWNPDPHLLRRRGLMSGMRSPSNTKPGVNSFAVR